MSARPASKIASTSRRQFLRGVGACLALPHLESVASAEISSSAAFPSSKIKNLAFVYTPNGVNTKLWNPQFSNTDAEQKESSQSYTTDYQLSPSMQPLAPHKDDIHIIQGLEHDKAKANGDGPGGHARANSTFLTATQIKKTPGKDFSAGTSIDQVIAAKLSANSPLNSLELGCDRTRKTGHCDSGYSCVYQHNLAWKNPTTPLSPQSDPRLVFERLFAGREGTNEQTLALRRSREKSVLDFILEDTHSLQNRLNHSDSEKLEQYLQAVRETEQRLERVEQARQSMGGALPQDLIGYRETADACQSIPTRYSEHIDLMYELMALAFQSGSTRVSTFLLSHEGSNRSIPEIGVHQGHHVLSHHQNNADKLDQIAKIDHFYMQRYAKFISHLKTLPGSEGGSLLDETAVLYGSGISDGNSHNPSNLPIILSGGGGSLKQGGVSRFSEATPMSNLYLSLAAAIGVDIETFGDSSGKLEGIFA